MNRKDFVKTSVLAVAAIAIAPTGTLFANTLDAKVKLAIIGIGSRGQNHLDLVLRRDDVELVAICDIDDRALKMAKEMISKSGKKMLQVYTGDNYAWKKILEIKTGVDGVLIVTPWEWHKPMVIGALEAGLNMLVQK